MRSPSGGGVPIDWQTITTEGRRWVTEKKQSKRSKERSRAPFNRLSKTSAAPRIEQKTSTTRVQKQRSPDTAVAPLRSRARTSAGWTDDVIAHQLLAVAERLRERVPIAQTNGEAVANPSASISGYHDPVTTKFIEATKMVRQNKRVPGDCFERREKG